MPKYKAIHNGRDDNTIKFGGNPINEVAYTSTSDSDLTWGYRGAGPTNTARSILEHAQGRLNISFSPEKLQDDFAEEFVVPKDKTQDWSISLADVKKFIQNHP